MKFQAIKGVRDILPPESALWNRVEQTARDVFGTFGFAEIRPPILEPSDLFDRSVGADTDIVSKEMYRIASAVEMGLRYLVIETEDLTSPIGADKYDTLLAYLYVFFIPAEEARKLG